MAKARVQLRHSESFTGLSGGLKWKKNQARTFTDASKIAYYKGHTEFVVTMLKEDPKPKRTAPAPNPEEPAGGEGEGESGEGGSGDGDTGSDGASEFSKSKLERMSKPELVDYAADRFKLALDEDEMKKDDLVAAILEAQG